MIRGLIAASALTSMSNVLSFSSSYTPRQTNKLFALQFTNNHINITSFTFILRYFMIILRGSIIFKNIFRLSLLPNSMICAKRWIKRACIIVQSDIQPHMLLNQAKWLIMPIYITSRISHLWLHLKRERNSLTWS